MCPYCNIIIMCLTFKENKSLYDLYFIKHNLPLLASFSFLANSELKKKKKNEQGLLLHACQEIKVQCMC